MPPIGQSGNQQFCGVVFFVFYLVVDGDLRVGVSFVERFHFAEMMFQRQLHHPEQHGDVCRQRLELQLPAHRLV